MQALMAPWMALFCLVAAAQAPQPPEIAARSYSWSTGRGFWSRPHAFESAFFVTYDWPAPAFDGSRQRTCT